MLQSDVVRSWAVGFLSDLLDIDPVRVVGDARFVDLGLDSMDAVVLSGAMEEEYGVELDSALFLRNPTLDGLMADLKKNGIVE